MVGKKEIGEVSAPHKNMTHKKYYVVMKHLFSEELI